jgi:hypothetical protein
MQAIPALPSRCHLCGRVGLRVAGVLCRLCRRVAVRTG